MQLVVRPIHNTNSTAQQQSGTMTETDKTIAHARTNCNGKIGNTSHDEHRHHKFCDSHVVRNPHADQLAMVQYFVYKIWPQW